MGLEVMQVLWSFLQLIISVINKHLHRCSFSRSRNLQCQRIFQVNAPINCVCLHPNQVRLHIVDFVSLNQIEKLSFYFELSKDISCVPEL